MRNYQRGQILLIVVLVMTIVLTVGLSIASRTITDLRTTNQQESSERAFSAAEAGIEKTLQNSTNSSGNFISNNSSYQTTVTSVSSTDFLLNNGITVLKDDAADLWLSTYPTYSNNWPPGAPAKLTIYWGSSTDVCTQSELTNSMAALDIVLISGTKQSPQLTHYPVDPCSDRTNINHFEFIPSGGGSVSGKQFAFKKEISVSPASGILLRIIPLYAPTIIGARGCDASGGGCQPLPSQGKIITSVGTSSNTQRKIIGFQENPKLPMQIFPYILFSSK